MKYYLINGELKKTPHEIIKKEELKNPDEFETVLGVWKQSLQQCEISESELMQIYNQLAYDRVENNGNPIEVTDIVFDNNGVISFKHPKQVEEIEAVDEIWDDLIDVLMSSRSLSPKQDIELLKSKFNIKRKNQK